MAAHHFRSLSTAMKTYVGVIVVVGLATVVQSVLAIAADPKGWDWTILAVLTLVSGSATVRLPLLPATFSVSETFVFTAVLLFGPAAGTLIVALDAFIISVWAHKKANPLYKIIFNVSALPLSIWVSSQLFFLFSGIQPLVDNDDPVQIKRLLGPLILFTMAYFGLNSGIIAFAIALERRLSPIKIWRENFVLLSLNYFGGASVAALLVSYTRDLDFTYLAVIVPLLIVLYLTFSTSMGRVEDANKHLTQLNTLYMSTIETLAMAIDAKDQITHGHIRRVQTYAVALAKKMGVTDDKLIGAIEAAALLHDMGKLAVPEYILNKPGPLTPAEFEKMKLHASVGADILSSIDFPYPVVPIVRHHHENWNGKGYPDGLSGSEIPIGARILSVVDCFDALTSDRPYRPRLPDKEAIRILLERRGTMYDPLVVDAFIKLHPGLATAVIPASEHPLSAISRAAVTSNDGRSLSLEDITASSGEVVALFALAHALGPQATPPEVGKIVFAHLRRLVPHSFGVLFIYVRDRDELSAAYATGVSASLLTGMTVIVGQRLSGWVAANRKTIRNSDPILDLGEVSKSISPRPRSCLSTPIAVGPNLVGVLSLYSAEQDFFSEEHERLVEAVARQVAPAAARAIDYVGADLSKQRRAVDSPESSVEVIDLLPEKTCLALIERRPTSAALEGEGLQSVIEALAITLDSKDLVFKRGSTQVAVLSQAKDVAAFQRAISAALHAHEETRFALASVPDGGRSVEQLLATADLLLRHEAKDTSSPRPSIH
jgi:putative nucleotidyltransferase with HDIG domain